jgi:hypothetical protein
MAMAIALALTAAPVQTRANTSCPPPPGSVRIAYHRGDVRVFDTNDATIACNGRAGRLVTIATGGAFISAQYASVGRYLAFVATQDDFDQTFFIRSVDLSNGRTAHRLVYRAGAGAAGALVL